MSVRPHRPFRLLDGVVLVAAAAAGIWLAKTSLQSEELDWASLDVGRVYDLFSLVLLPLTAAVTVLRLVGPRPSLRRLCRQPGFVGCAALLIASAFVMSCGWCTLKEVTGETVLGLVDSALMFSFVSSITFSAWLILLLGCRWRPERSWIDRLGRGLTAIWLLSMPVLTAVRLIHSIRGR